MAEKCKGFICGGNLVDGSVPSDKLDKETIIELIRDSERGNARILA